MSSAPSTRAVLLDALGTLVELEPPFARLAELLGGDLPLEAVERAMRAEMRYYREHSHEGRDPASLSDLRARCAAVLSRELGREVPVATMMAAIRFRPYPDAVPALRGLRERGLRLGCVSNWDCSLPDVLERVGVRELLDFVAVSATVGARKPDPRLFAAALELAGVAAGEALHVGDTPGEDLAGAEAAGIPVLLLVRNPTPAAREPPAAAPGPAVVSSLLAISDHLRP